ncbi:MAG: flagellar hook-basal body complex protein FliE [Bradymonadia bacterium]|jgi:flagellar hook-basal body complex protein FliE
MNISPIGAHAAMPAIGRANATAPTEVANRFRATLGDAVNAVNDQALRADSAVHGMVESQGSNLHEAMIELEKADLSVRLATRVAQKLVSAYQEISRMQV